MWELGRGVGSPSSLKGAWPALCTLLWLVLALLTPLFYLGSLSTAFRLPLHPHCTLKCWALDPAFSSSAFVGSLLSFVIFCSGSCLTGGE